MAFPIDRALVFGALVVGEVGSGAGPELGTELGLTFLIWDVIFGDNNSSIIRKTKD